MIRFLELMPTLNTLTLYEIPPELRQSSEGDPDEIFHHQSVTCAFLNRLRIYPSSVNADTESTSSRSASSSTTPLLPHLVDLELGVYDDGTEWCTALVEAVLSRHLVDGTVDWGIARLGSLELVKIGGAGTSLMTMCLIGYWL